VNDQDELYRKYLTFTDLMLEDYEPLEVAAIMSVIALSMYKTCLDSEGFENIIDKISESRDSVKPFSGGGLLN
jgi:hypothetical protein